MAHVVIQGLCVDNLLQSPYSVRKRQDELPTGMIDDCDHVFLTPTSISSLQVQNMWLTDQQKIGVGITSAGLLFLMLGIMTFFDAALLALGDILFLSGITLVIGPKKTVAFFARRNKLRGTACFMGGILLVFLRYPFWGMLIEMFGFLNLFGDFFPVVITFMRQLPIIGSFLNMPGVRQVVDKIAGAGARRTPV